MDNPAMPKKSTEFVNKLNLSDFTYKNETL